jgi:hypothetical protein
MFLAVAFCRAQTAVAGTAEFPFQYREGLLWIEVEAPQSEKPLNFLLDTGAGVSVVNLSTARRLGLELGREVAVQGVRTTLTGYWQTPMSAAVGDLQLPRSYLAVDLEKLSRSCERPVDGLVGADFFRDRTVQIDFDARKIRLLDKVSAGKGVETLPLRLRECGMLVPLRVNGQKRQWVRLDTGCASALQWVASDVKPLRCGRQMAIGLADVSIPQTLTAVELGKHRIEMVPTGLHESAIFPGEAGLLGNGLLAGFSAITIDAKERRVLLEER